MKGLMYGLMKGPTKLSAEARMRGAVAIQNSSEYTFPPIGNTLFKVRYAYNFTTLVFYKNLVEN